MPVLRNWWLPVLLGIGQLLAWPVGPLIAGQRLEPVMIAVAVVVTLVLAVALGWRRTAPIGALTVIGIALYSATMVLPDDALSFVAVADLIALYSVAVWRSAKVTAIAVIVILACQPIVLSTVDDPGVAMLVPFIVVAYVLTAALGRARGRWWTAREAAAERLLSAEAERLRAADAEWDRLARELHDVTAHHLTAIVVQAGAARRLGATQPALVGQALDFAVETGRRTLTALHRLVAVVDPDAVAEPLATRVNRLADAAGRAGHVVRVDLAGPVAAVPVALADAVHAVLREAVTNAMRYAPGVPVTAVLTVSAGEVRLTVDNPAGDPAAGSLGAHGAERLGSGRGLGGLDLRITELGGTFAAGPEPTGGWRVHAVLPTGAPADRVGEPPGGAARPAPPWWQRLISHERIIDASVTIAVALPPLLLLVAGASSSEEPPGGNEPALLLLVLLLVGHAAPVWWRRRSPWRALLAVLAAAFGYAVVVALTGMPTETTWLLAVGGGAEVVTVYAVGAYARPALTSAVGVAATGGIWALVLAAASDVRDGFPRGEFTYVTAFTFGTFVVLATLVIMVGLVPVWLLAALLRRRRERTLAAEDAALTAAARRAAAAAIDQRVRFAAGLHASVLHPAQRLIAAAEAGRAAARLDPAGALAAVDRVIAEARAGLAAMRELLGALGSDSARATAPPRGTADLVELCAVRSAAGRDVTLEASPAPYPMPVAVDLSCYRIVDAALDTDDTDACVVSVGYVDQDLSVTVSGVPSAVDGVVEARIRARVAALGGTVRFDPAGVVAVRLPAVREEVAVP